MNSCTGNLAREIILVKYMLSPAVVCDIMRYAFQCMNSYWMPMKSCTRNRYYDFILNEIYEFMDLLLDLC